MKLKTLYLTLIFLLFFSGVAAAKPTPYRITEDNSLEVDGLFYYNNGIPELKLPLTLSSDKPNYNYVAAGDIYKMYYAMNVSKDTAFLSEFDGTNVSFVPKSILTQNYNKTGTKAQNVQAVVNGSVITYPGMFGAGIDYRLTYSSMTVKEELILAQNPYPLAPDNDTFIFKHRFNYSSLTPYVNGVPWDKSAQETSEAILFKNSIGETYFEFKKPYAIDATGKTVDLTYDLSYNAQGQNAGEMNIKLNVPMWYLNYASYPVIIDPSLEQNGGSTTLDGTQSYTYVNVTNGGIIYVTAYNGAGTTGRLTLNVSNDVNVDATSSIIGFKRGYRGGNGGAPNTGGSGGEVAGSGGGSNGGSSGGWGGAGAGGGGYAATGGNGGNSYSDTGGAGGSAQGTSNGWDCQMGNGGGGGGGQTFDVSGQQGEPGGAMLRMNVGGTAYIYGTVNMSGGKGGNGASTGLDADDGGAGGGAAGGCFLINATNIIYNSNTVIELKGGLGGGGWKTGGTGGVGTGGTGSGGRYKAFYKGTYTTTGATITSGSTYSEDTNAAPSAPTTNTHSNYHTSASTTVTWGSVSDPNGDPVTYTVKVGTTSGGTNVLNYAGDTDTTSNSFTMTSQNTYHYSVKACDPYECSAWSTEKSFTFTNSAPSVPSLTAHANFHSITSTTTVNFTASTDSDGDSITYDIKVYNTTTGVLVVNQAGTSNNYSTSFSLLNWTNYNFTARAYDSYTYSSWATASTFGFSNSIPTIQDVTVKPSSPIATDNLVVTMNATDSDSDTLVKHYLWYKNGELNAAWNDTTTLIYTGNFTTADSIYVKGYVNDSFNDSEQSTSNTVIIGSGNSAPVLPGITLNPSTRKYNKTVWVNTTNVITDAESSEVRLQVYYYNLITKTYLGNSSWVTPPGNASVNFSVPWNDGMTYTIYAVAEDSGNALGQSNLTSSEATATFTSDINPPTLTNSSLNAASITIGGSVTITAVADGVGANIASATVQVERPDATIANWAMTCTGGEIATCTKLYTSTSDIGTYYVRYINLTDDSGNIITYESSLEFTATAVESGGSGGGGGGYVQPTPSLTDQLANVSKLLPPINFVNVTDTRSTADLEKIGQCLSQDFMLSSKCAGGTIGIVSNPMNYWVLVGAYIFSFIVVFAISMVEDKPRQYFTDTVIYGTFTVIFVMLFSLAGMNMFVLNYVFQSSLPGWMFASFGMWAMFIAMAGDQYTHRGNKSSKKRSNREFEFIDNVGKEIENNYAIRMWNENVMGKK